MKKNFKSYSIVLLFTLFLFSGICNIIPSYSKTGQPSFGSPLSNNLNQNNQGGMLSNPFGFNPFQGLNLNQQFFKIPQMNQYQFGHQVNQQQVDPQGSQKQTSQQINQQQQISQQGNQQQANQQVNQQQVNQQPINQQHINQQVNQQGNQQQVNQQLNQQQVNQQVNNQQQTNQVNQQINQQQVNSQGNQQQQTNQVNQQINQQQVNSQGNQQQQVNSQGNQQQQVNSQGSQQQQVNSQVNQQQQVNSQGNQQQVINQQLNQQVNPQIINQQGGQFSQMNQQSINQQNIQTLPISSNNQNQQQQFQITGPQSNILTNHNIGNQAINQNSQQLTNNAQLQSIGPFKFSPSLKHHDLSISQNRVKSQLTGSQKIFMMDLPLGKQCQKGCTSEFRINQNTGWMTLGVCDKKKILLNNLRWDRSKVGHGAYLIGSFGGTWSSLNQTQNNVMKSFRYTTNDTIRVIYSPRDQTIIFDKKGSNDTYTIQYDWRDEQLHLCGMLYYANDQIEYLGTKSFQPLNELENLDDRFEVALRASKIQLGGVDRKNIHAMFDNKIRNIKLCYRGSQNSFSAAAFHKNCDNVINTMVLLQTNHGRKLGAYTPLLWSGSYTYTPDNLSRSFIFSITHNQKLTLKVPQNAIYVRNDYGPTFGGGHDLYISDRSNSGGSSCNIGNSYNYAFSGPTGYDRLCGGQSFTTKQYEVYQVIFDEKDPRFKK